ncbi:MAG: sulfotransferase domain-containing protein [Rhizobiales bacterium]|nr:sulfotransferase domain-containing protein [Hyphomicrobiales bacterium]
MSKTPKPPVSRKALSKLNLLWHRTRIVSYPSSGRTWLRVMLAELGARPRFTHANSRFRSGATPDTVASDISEHYHRRVLFLLRDPKDTLASNYNHVTRGHGWKGDFKTFIHMPRYGLERMLTFHTAWLEARHKFKRGFRVETYEDLRADTASTLQRIVDFLGVPGVTMEEIEAAAARNQFEKMQQREVSGELKAQYAARFSGRDMKDPLARRVRRGRVGGHAEDMDAEDLAYCDALLAKFDYAAIVAETLRQQDEAA